MPRPAGVLVQPRPRGGRAERLPALLDDQLALARPRAVAVELAGDSRAAQAVDVPLDVVGDRERQRRREPIRQAGEVEQHQRRVLVDRGAPVGDVRERPVLAVGAEAQQQRLQLVGVGAGQLPVRAGVVERVDQQLLARPLAGCWPHRL